MNQTEWWRDTAIHMWRTFFAMENSSPHERDIVKRKLYVLCQYVMSALSAQERDIVRTYFTSRWGDDRNAVRTYARKHHMRQNAVWFVVRKAQRMIIEEIGLIEKREE